MTTLPLVPPTTAHQLPLMGASDDREFEVVRAAVATRTRRVAVASDAAFETALAADGLDWDRVVDLALSHEVPFWVERALPATVPALVRERLQAARRPLALAALAGGAQLLEATRALERAGVRAVGYKGPALAAELHGDPAARRFTDLDLLIAERDRAAAVAALRAVGYRTTAGDEDRSRQFYERWEGVTHLARRDDELSIELHWRCQAPRYGAPQDPAEVVAAAVPGALAGVLVPAPAHHAALLALHGMKHGWRSLLWVADFAAATAHPAFEWSAFDAIVTRWQAQRPTRVAMRLVRALGLIDVERDEEPDAVADRLATSAVARLRGQPHEDLGEPSSARYELRWIEGAGARCRYLALAALLPTAQEQRAVALPDALLPLAYPVRLARLAGHALWRTR